MERFKHDLALKIVKILDAILLTIPFALCWLLYYGERIAQPYYSKGNVVIIALFLFVYIALGKVYEGFLVSMNRISEMVYSQALAVLVTDGILYIVIILLSKRMPNLLPGLCAFAGQIVLALIWSWLAHQWYFSKFPPQTTVVVYDTRQGMEKLIDEYGFDKKFAVRKCMPVEECLKNLSVLDDVKTVFLSGIHSHDRNIILKYCVEADITVYVIPRVGDVIMSGAKVMHMFHLPMLRVGRYHPSPIFLTIKRGFDILVSGIAIVILSPIMAIVALAIKKTDGGPVFYKQVRLTKDGREFKVMKFRSMRVDAEKDGVARLSTGDKDDRITPVGHFIRKVRLDELPQLFNILKGDMSIVGPRPERPEIAAEYEKEMPEWVILSMCTIMSFVFGIYTWLAGKRKKEFSYISNSHKIIEKGNSRIPQLELKYEGRDIDNLTITNYVIWNTGNEVINFSDMVAEKELKIYSSNTANTISLFRTKVKWNIMGNM